jgi:hypothetical protein
MIILESPKAKGNVLSAIFCSQIATLYYLDQYYQVFEVPLLEYLQELLYFREDIKLFQTPS